MKAHRHGMFALAVLAGSPAFASDHQFSELAGHFVSAWNQHNQVEMAGRLTENAKAVDGAGRTFVGRGPVTQALTAAPSTLTLTSPVVVRAVGREPGTNERDLGYEGVISFTAELSNDESGGTHLTFTLQLVWGADLSGEHVGGRYFINSLRMDPVTP